VLELIEAHTYSTGAAIHLYRPKRASRTRFVSLSRAHSDAGCPAPSWFDGPHLDDGQCLSSRTRIASNLTLFPQQNSHRWLHLAGAVDAVVVDESRRSQVSRGSARGDKGIRGEDGRHDDER
jgi:hypothetical protein